MDQELLSTIHYDAEDVDVEQIMFQIRSYLAQKQGASAKAPAGAPAASIFDNEVYDQLYLANQTHDRLHIAPYLTTLRVPLVAGLLQRVRARFHALVVFYVGRLAEAQMRFNAHVVRTLNAMVQDIEASETPTRMRQLEQRVLALEERLAAHESQVSAGRPDAVEDRG